MMQWAKIVGMTDDVRRHMLRHGSGVGSMCNSSRPGCDHCFGVNLPCSEVIHSLDKLESLTPPRDSSVEECASGGSIDKYKVIPRWLREARDGGLIAQRTYHACQDWLARTYL